MRTANKAELTRILKISAPTLADWIARHGVDFPVVERGSRGRDWVFDVDQVLAFLAHKKDDRLRKEAERRLSLEQLFLPMPSIERKPPASRPISERAAQLLAALGVPQLHPDGVVCHGHPVELATLLSRTGLFLTQLTARLEEELADADPASFTDRAALRERLRGIQARAMDETQALFECENAMSDSDQLRTGPQRVREPARDPPQAID